MWRNRREQQEEQEEQEERGERDPTNNYTTTYVMAVVALAVIGVVAIVVLMITRPEKDNTQAITIILGFLVPLATALLAGAVQQLHLAVNSRLTELLSVTKQAARADGMMAGRMEGRTAGRADGQDVADALKAGQDEPRK